VAWSDQARRGFVLLGATKLVGHQAFVFPRIGVSDLNRARKRKIDEIRLNDQIFRVVTTPNLISDRSNVLGAAQSVGHA
jgi:hypothetical protein